MFPLVEIHQISEKATSTNGDSTLIRYTDHFKKNNILIDCGLKNAVVSDYLKSIGVTELDLMIASHIDRDHIGGLNSVLNDVDVKELWIMNVNPFKQFIEKSIGFNMEKAHFLRCFVAAHESIRTAKGKNVRCVSVYEGYKDVVGPFFLEVLWPPYHFEGFLEDPANVKGILETGKGKTYKKFLEEMREKGNKPQDIETEIAGPKEVDLEELNWISKYVKDFKDYPEETFVKNFDLASRGLLNNVSIVVRITCLSPPCSLNNRFGALVMLFPGDLEDWAYLYSKYFRYIEADILKIPHHGSRKVEINGKSLYTFLNPRLSLLFPLPQCSLPTHDVRNLLVRTNLLSCTSCKGSSPSKIMNQSCYYDYNCFPMNTAIYKISSLGFSLSDGRNICAGLLKPQ